jgi:hypothetical protein
MERECSACIPALDVGDFTVWVMLRAASGSGGGIASGGT